MKLEMKSYKVFLNIGLIFVVVLSFLTSASKGHAQTDQDWSVPVNLSLSGVATNPVMVIDARGVIHAIWVDDIDGYKYAQSADGGATWTRATSVKFPFQPSDSPPTLLAGVNGVINIFWLSRGELFYAQTTPSDFGNPGNWITTTRLASNVLNFDVIMDSQDKLHLAYINNSTSKDGTKPPGVYYSGTGSSGSWTEPAKLYESEYFRSTKRSESYIRVAASDSLPNQNIYVTWDNRDQKRVFMAVSKNSGVDWSSPQQVKGPEDTGGNDSPFNLSVAALNENVLLMWQVGEPGASICTLYSQWSKDGGNTWGDSIAVLGGRSECPLGAKFVSRTKDYITVLLNGEVSPALLAWDGQQWSKVQTQTQLPSFTNPLTYDPILLECRFDLINKDRLYVAGCDKGQGGDVWFLSRSLVPVENWFSPSLIWGEPVVLSIKAKNPERISDFYVAPDNRGNIHAVWAQSSTAREARPNMAINYARWSDGQWTTPEPSIIYKTKGKLSQLLLTADPLDRLLLAWVDEQNGDLAFSWANSGKANLASEWEDVSSLPSPSQLIDSSDMVVDGSGRIISTYVVPVNEDRGVYVVQSVDNGKDWSTPVRAFDAVSASWERIGQSRLSLDASGTLHLIFVRDTVRQGQPVGLYYSRSIDGGKTWSDAQVLSEGEIEWADIVSYDKTVHVIWQEYDGLVFANLSQISQDGGLSWSKQKNVTGVNEGATSVSLGSDGHGLLHFVQLVNKSNGEEYNQKNLILQDWKWNGSNWELELAKDIAIKGEGIKYSLSAAITSTGYLGVFMPVEYNDPAKDNGFKSEVLTFARFLGKSTNSGKLVQPVIPTPIAESGGLDAPILMPTATPDFSILYDDSVATSPLQRTFAGLILIIVGVVVTIVLLIRRRSVKR
jgi:hypothetical protein